VNRLVKRNYRYERLNAEAAASAEDDLEQLLRDSLQSPPSTESQVRIVGTRARFSKRSSPICSASQFRRIIAASGGCALTACTRAPRMSAR
jgi:hypothetical protein